MDIIARLANLPGALPGACAQGLIWGIMAIGVYLTYRILDVADLTVDGSFGTGGAVCVMCLLSGMNVWLALLVAVLAGLATGLVTGLLHTFMGIPAILAGILTQLALYSINLKIMGKANQSINVDKYGLLISLRWVKEFALHNPIIMIILVTGGGHRRAVLVLRHRAGLCHPCHRFQPRHVPCTGHQHQLQHRAGAGRVQRTGGPVRCSAEPVSGLCGCGHGPRCHRHRSGRRHHWRGRI